MDRDRLHLATPEGLTLDLDLAGAGSRGVAALIDLVIQVAALYVVTRIANGGSNLGIIVFIVLNVVVVFGYYLFFELRVSGQTLGKRVMRLRVVRSDGGPIRLPAALLRTFLRIPDFLPFGYVIGMITVLSTGKNQRLGDLAAGTVVVQEGPSNRRVDPLPIERETSHQLAEANSPAAGWDVSRVTPEETALIRNFLDRRWGLARPARHQLAIDLELRFAQKVVIPPDVRGAEPRLEGIVRAKGHDVGGLPIEPNRRRSLRRRSKTPVSAPRDDTSPDG